MPIYAYRCSACGHQQDHLQKMSDALLTDCPQCGKAEYKKMLTAAGFQLKGSGWYVTDFRGGSSGTAAASTTGGKDSSSSAAASTSGSTDSAKSDSSSTSSSTSTSTSTSGGSDSSAAAA